MSDRVIVSVDSKIQSMLRAITRMPEGKVQDCLAAMYTAWKTRNPEAAVRTENSYKKPGRPTKQVEGAPIKG